ncbi:hypothetical protein [Fulvivirga lutea]|uniref:Uncharacterized protein n=1 Tax=Fulvivirga lutea TaxID=2810512 RepID=A0A975A2E4_9BACT|nr:hypothetical protein [Fulvivirga lutea]QSE99205.1 hypothetical protein JR347_08985 [Fulvivirga lutea]
MKKELKSLIGLLFDISADLNARDDAPYYLRDYDQPEALEALILYASEGFKIPGDDDDDISMLKGSCGESIAFMWLRKEIFDITAYNKLSKEAQLEIIGLFKANRPDLIKF